MNKICFFLFSKNMTLALYLVVLFFLKADLSSVAKKPQSPYTSLLSQKSEVTVNPRK
jgi:hypothetical protein